MNEASSKYVDQIATEKLISEKLKHAHHRTLAGRHYSDTRLDMPDEKRLHDVMFSEGENNGGRKLSFPSLIETGYPENDRVIVNVYRAENEAGSLIFVHGLYEDNVDIYSFFIRQLNEKGLSVYLIKLPFHYDRTPSGSAFSGEYFWSGDVNRSALGFKQAVYDLYRLYGLLRDCNKKPVTVAGFSMGGGVALIVSALVGLDGVFAINPVCNFARLVWTSPLFATIKEDLEKQGFDEAYIAKQYHDFDPLNALNVKTAPEHIVIGRALYDQINHPENYDLLLRKWKIKQVIAYKAGHLNILRVPKLAADVYHLFETVKAK